MLIMGHRGARYEAPENTVAGFDHAVRLGLQAVEFDVRLTSDNRVAVIHDATVDRTTDGEGPVADLTLAELQELDARSMFPDWATDCRIPALAEVLEVIGGLDTFEIEIKHDEPDRLDVLVPLVLAELDRRSLDQAVFTSFDSYALELVGRLAPDRPRGWIADFDSPDDLDVALELGVQRVGVPVETGSAEIVAAARDKGLTVVGWPTNTRDEFDENVRRNVDVLCTASPSTIRGWLPPHSRAGYSTSR